MNNQKELQSKAHVVANGAAAKLVGTLTFHEAINYGAALQAYALQQAIIKLGYRSEIINYSCGAIRKAYEAPASLKAKIGWYLRAKARGERVKKFAEFFDELVNASAPVDRVGFNEFAEKYSSIVVGSDQVWNPKLTKGDMTYFLDCVEDSNKKKSYAASLGVRSWDASLENSCARALEEFSALTVREETAADYLNGLLGERPSVVCDPTFLLGRDEWDEVAAPRLVDKPYVLMYCFGRPEVDALSWAKEQARAKNCELVLINLAAFPVSGVINMRGAGPREFLSLIKHAELVVTHSFHGICFSIIFQRDFCWFNSDSASIGLKGRTSRIEDMLARFGLEDRAVHAGSCLPNTIDYTSVNQAVSNLRKSSIAVLRNML